MSCQKVRNWKTKQKANRHCARDVKHGANCNTSQWASGQAGKDLARLGEIPGEWVPLRYCVSKNWVNRAERNTGNRIKRDCEQHE
jgi:hypothetical protein